MQDELIAVVGAAGKLGGLVVDALLETPGVRVRALVRDPGKLAARASERVEVVAFDATTADQAARDAAMRGVYTVVSTLQGGPDVIIEAQLGLLHAAKAAGARRFIPSDYSYDFFTLPAGINVNSDWRRTFAERAAAAVTPTFEVVHVLQGIFLDAGVLGFLGMLDGERGVVRYWGDGTTPIDWTTWSDTARFTAAAAIDERPVPARLFVRGDRMDVLQFAAAWEAAHGRPLRRERLGSLEELAAETQRQLAAEPTNMYAWLPLMYARGVFGGQALQGGLHNDRWPEIQPTSVAAALAAGAA
jgi:nucleoside-diphosphate-sugar epimerase